MTDVISKKLESKIDNKLNSKRKRKHLDDGFKKGKVVNEVLDKPTVMTLYKMITDHIIAFVNGSVSAGKESVLFWGVDENDVDVALKIYLVSTSNFKKREPYITGDPRFSHLKKGTKKNNGTCGIGEDSVQLYSRRASLVNEFCLDKKENNIANIETAEQLLRETIAPCDFASTTVTLISGEGTSEESILQFDPRQS